jgi:predicted DNA-binding transcriptional regulator AlpA
MGTHHTRSRRRTHSSEAAQMVLAIEVPHAAVPIPSKARLYRSRYKRDRDLGIDPIVYMRDVVRIVGRHRSTILRWIDRKSFPPKSVPRDHPSGWLRSEIESWQRGVVAGQIHDSSGGDAGRPR